MPLALLLLLGSFDAVREEGARLEAARQWDAAAAVYEDALHRCSPCDPENEMFWLFTSLSEMSFNRGDYAAARQWLHRAEKILPAASPAWVQLWNASGALYLVQGNLSAAEHDLLQAIAAAAPQALPGTFHNLASIEMQTGRLQQASDHQRQAIALWRAQYGDRHEYLLRGWISLSSIQGLQRDWRGAEESLRNALAIAETPEALANYAIVLDHLKRGKEAKQIRIRIRSTTPVNALIDAKALPNQGAALNAIAR